MNYKNGKWSWKKCKVCNNMTYRTFCSNKCHKVHELELLFEKIDRGEYVAKPNGGNTTLKKYLIIRRGKRCEICQNENWMGKEIPLTSHHVDGNANNNRPENLQLLCGNCHGQAPNFGRKNKKSARTTRYKQFINASLT